ncbi:TPA: hypothetical protein OME37_004664 [Klebsiella michiganensis]|nr:hypothetical protein [Klebsiella michiganensis]ELS4625795.1 hypothetical protein [Klebsiella michiganensis]HCQ8476892.1 hypothetical protein [Klebsiella michiganensis]HCU0766847.1 hypothetical protein [Klebsiella michiganensis]HEP0440759.1 hypothetical protein [Klebsiella michiganensis]
MKRLKRNKWQVSNTLLLNTHITLSKIDDLDKIKSFGINSKYIRVRNGRLNIDEKRIKGDGWRIEAVSVGLSRTHPKMTTSTGPK